MWEYCPSKYNSGRTTGAYEQKLTIDQPLFRDGLVNFVELKGKMEKPFINIFIGIPFLPGSGENFSVL